jgi:hypothetical protein
VYVPTPQVVVDEICGWRRSSQAIVIDSVRAMATITRGENGGAGSADLDTYR